MYTLNWTDLMRTWIAFVKFLFAVIRRYNPITNSRLVMKVGRDRVLKSNLIRLNGKNFIFPNGDTIFKKVVELLKRHKGVISIAVLFELGGLILESFISGIPSKMDKEEIGELELEFLELEDTVLSTSSKSYNIDMDEDGVISLEEYLISERLQNILRKQSKDLLWLLLYLEDNQYALRDILIATNKLEEVEGEHPRITKITF